MPARKASILVVDDDAGMLRMMQRALELEDYQVFTALNGETALVVFDQEMPDLMLLDVTMPGMSGYAVCRRIRESSKIPIIMVTGRNSEEEKVAGLNAGADDYVTKPFSTRELVARVEAVLRRSKLWDERPGPAYRSDDLVVDFARHNVTVGGEEIDLTATEYRLLSYLARNAGRDLTPEQILEAVWGKDYAGERPFLRVNMDRLRRKLGALRTSWPTGLRPEDWKAK